MRTRQALKIYPKRTEGNYELHVKRYGYRYSRQQRKNCEIIVIRWAARTQHSGWSKYIPNLFRKNRKPRIKGINHD